MKKTLGIGIVVVFNLLWILGLSLCSSVSNSTLISNTPSYDGLIKSQITTHNVKVPVATTTPMPVPVIHIPNEELDFNLVKQPFMIAQQFKFTEGPVWDKTRQVLLFSDIEANRIYQLALKNSVSIYRAPSNKSNGLVFDSAHHLLAAEHGSRSVTLTQADGTIVTIADYYQGKKLNSPDDLTVRADGSIYFTDPTYGLENRQAGVDFMGLYRLSPFGDIVLEGKFDQFPNGVALSPDQKTLFLALTAANQVISFDLSENGDIKNSKVFANVPVPDGLAVDVIGDIYVAGLDGIYLFSSQGTLLGKIKTARQPANCKFGGPSGKILFITARDFLYGVDMPIPGF